VGYVDTGFGTGPEFDSWIAVPPEQPVVGLPKELAEAVLSGSVAEIAAGWPAGPGELRFGYAAHGLYGSSGSLFSLLARLVVVVIREPSADAAGLGRLLTEAVA